LLPCPWHCLASRCSGCNESGSGSLLPEAIIDREQITSPPEPNLERFFFLDSLAARVNFSDDSMN
jgi:hypothetical protein